MSNNKKSFVDRILAKLQGGDQSNLERFYDKLEKFFKSQIRIKREKIETIEDRIKDQLGDVQETILNIDVNSLKKGQDADDYCPTYVAAVDKSRKAVEKSKLEIEAIEDEIKDLEANRDLILASKEELVAG